MTAYRLTPVGASGPEPDRAVVVDIPSRAELLLQNERLKADLETARRDAANWQAMWSGAHAARAAAETRADSSTRVLAVLERADSEMVARARREVGRLDE